jgi:hypothetical protein
MVMAQVIQPTITENEVPFFFDKSNKVVAPVRGGGKGSLMGKTVAI